MYERRDFTAFDLERVNAALGEMTRKEQSPVRVTARFAALPPDAADIVFQPGHEVQFLAPSEFSSIERRNYFTNRWMCTWRLFAEVKRRYPQSTGQCRLWLEDVPGGPGLAFCSRRGSPNTLIPDALFLESDGYAALRAQADANRIPWAVRQDLVFWRGASTGSRHVLGLTRWQDIPRFRLCLLVKSQANRARFDVALSSIVQVSDTTELEQIAAAGILGDPVPQDAFMKYRYSIDVDGNSASWPGLITKLIMGVTTIKVASEIDARQWYYDRLVPWQHYVPVSASMSDLFDVTDWLVAHPAEAEAIAAAGTALADELTLDRVVDDVAPIIHAAISASPLPAA